MKINSLNLFKNSYTVNSSNLQRPLGNLVLHSLSSDVFVKNQNINFTSKLPMDTSYIENFAEILDYCKNTDKFDIDSLQEVINKFSSDVKVFDITNDELSFFGNEYTRAVFAQSFDVGKSDNIDKELYVSIPKNNNADEKIDFVYKFLHEVIHVMQAEASDRVGFAELINSMLIENYDENMAGSFVDKFQNFLNAIQFSLDDYCEYRTAIETFIAAGGQINLNSGLDRDYKNMLKESFVKFQNRMVDEGVEKVFVKNSLYKYLKNLLALEKEAYYKGNFATAILLDDKQEILAKSMKVSLYSLAISALDELMQEQKD